MSLRVALGAAFARPWAYPLAIIGAAGMWLLLAWSGALIQQYPSGWEFHSEPWRLAALIVLAGMFGLLLPLEAAALSKARGAAGMAGGTAGTLFGLLSMSCCAPLVIPALLSFVGFSGTTILAVNTAVSPYEVPLTLGALVLMAASVALVSHTVAAACKLPASR